MIEILRRLQRNLKRRAFGAMKLRWDRRRHEAERQFREIVGYRDLATLVVAIADAAAIDTVTAMLAPGPRRSLCSSPSDRHA